MRYGMLIWTVLIGFSSCAQSKWINLLDENMSHWDSYLSYRHQLGYDGSMPTDENGVDIAPVGINNDSYGVFSIIREGNEDVLRVSGEIYGCVYTKQEYENYHLRLQFKWGQQKWIPRKDLLMDSGILYHSIGDLGVDHWRSWMVSQEFQIMEGHTGDYWSQATTSMSIRAYVPEYVMNPMAHSTQDYITMGYGEDQRGYCLRSNNYEKPMGEWNTLELISYGDKSIHIVNGEVVMILKESKYREGDQIIPLTKGKIQLQSEAAELFFKDIAIKSIAEIPAEYLGLF